MVPLKGLVVHHSLLPHLQFPLVGPGLDLANSFGCHVPVVQLLEYMEVVGSLKFLALDVRVHVGVDRFQLQGRSCCRRLVYGRQ